MSGGETARVAGIEGKSIAAVRLCGCSRTSSECQERGDKGRRTGGIGGIAGWNGPNGRNTSTDAASESGPSFHFRRCGSRPPSVPSVTSPTLRRCICLHFGFISPLFFWSLPVPSFRCGCIDEWTEIRTASQLILISLMFIFTCLSRTDSDPISAKL